MNLLRLVLFKFNFFFFIKSFKRYCCFCFIMNGVYSVFSQTVRYTMLMPGDEKWLYPKLNGLYDRELAANRIKQYSGYGIECSFALINSQELIIEKNIREAIGFGIAFPVDGNDISNRIIIFQDLIDTEFLEIVVAHEFSHLSDEKETDHEEEKKAFKFELEVAKLARKKTKWLAYNRREYPRRVKQLREMGLI